MRKDKEKFDYANFLEMVKRLDEKEKREKEEADRKKIGDLTFGELKNLIRSTIKTEATTGDLPLLNNTQNKKLKKWIWVSVVILFLSGLGYKTFWYESANLLEINKDKLFIRKVKGWTTEKKEIKVLSNKWQLCSLQEGEFCSPIFTPFEAIYNDYYKFIFVRRGSVFWVRNDQREVTLVKLIDGSWSFKNDGDESGWTDFDSFYEPPDYEPVDPR